MKIKTILVGTGLALAVLLSVLLHPALQPRGPHAKLAELVPPAFGEWQHQASQAIQVDVTPSVENTSRDSPYDDLLSRTYINSNGDAVMVAIAYGSQQRQEVKIHRPELCYPAQGWTVKSMSATSFAAPSVAGGTIPGFRLITQSQDGSYELVSYWIRIGNTFSQGGLSTRLAIIKEGLQGKMVDGILVRASQRTSDLSTSTQKFELQEKLLAEMAGSIKNTPDNVLIN